MHRIVVVLLFALWLATPVAAASKVPAIARPGLAENGDMATETRGVVFFLRAEGIQHGIAVGTAHTFPFDRLVRADRVDFFLARSMRRVASASGLLVEPGLPFSLPDATIRGDFLIYALDGAPDGVRLLEAERELPQIGSRVMALGLPDRGDADEDEVYGRVASASRDRINVDLDVPKDLGGWGGAPVVDVRTGRVIGMLEAHVPHEGTPRIIAAPIGGVLGALNAPLEGGAGRPLAAFAAGGATATAAATKSTTSVGSSGRAGGASSSSNGGDKHRLLSQDEPVETSVHLEIEYPEAGSVVGNSSCGVFVAGRAMAMRGNIRRFDVVMVIDTSFSTIEPAGTDIDGDGNVGLQRGGRLGAIFGAGSSDPGDSILAAEVAAARQLLRGLDPRSTRVSLVAFAGDQGQSGWGRRDKPAYTLEPLTRDYGRIQHSLDYLLDREPAGSTHMAAGVDQATIELIGLRGGISEVDHDSEKVVFFFTDGQPTLPYGPEAQADNVRAVLRAANRAHRRGIRIHSFAIGPDALEGPIAVVEMAMRTDGYFTPVRHPGDLVDIVEEVSFANLERVTVTSETTGEEAKLFRTTADGTWAAFVKMKPGENRIHAHARADDGTEADRTVTVTFMPEGTDPTLPNALVVQRNRLLEDCLRETKALRLDAEREAAEMVRRELQLEIERERAKARSRADEQRKQLRLEGVGDEGEDDFPDS